MWNMYGGLGSLIMRTRSDEDDSNSKNEDKSKTISDRSGMSMFNENRVIRRRRNTRRIEKSFSIQPFGNYSEARYIKEAIKDDPILMEFFKSIEKEADRIDDIDSEKVRKSIEEKLELQAERVRKIDILIKEIRDSGLDLKIDNENAITIGVPVNKSQENSFVNKGKYASEKRCFDLKYNGITLEEEWFIPENRQINPLEKEYNQWLKKNENINLEKEIKKADKQFKKADRQYSAFFPINKEKIEKKFDETLEKYKNLVAEKEKGEELRVKKENLDDITLEQKEKLYEIFELIKECKETGKHIDLEKEVYLSLGVKVDSDISMIDVETAECKRKKWKRVIENLKQRGEITEEMIDAVDSILLELSLGFRSYNVKNKEDDKDNYSYIPKKFERAISGYLRERINKSLEKDSKKQLEEKRTNERTNRRKNRYMEY